MDYKIISFVGIILFIAIMFMYYEKKKISIIEICLIATLSALCGVFRVPFAFLPNIQPTTFMVICCGIVFGPLSGFVIGAIATIVSNSFLGHGSWTLWQMLAWGLCGFSGGVLKIFLKNKISLSIFCFSWGFLFGLIMNIWHFLFFVYPHNIKTLFAVFMSSFFFDFAHSLGNFIFAYTCGMDFINILDRFKSRLSLYDFKKEDYYEKN